MYLLFQLRRRVADLKLDEKYDCCFLFRLLGSVYGVRLNILLNNTSNDMLSVIKILHVLILRILHCSVTYEPMQYCKFCHR